MRIAAVIKKSIKEQTRSFWLLLLTISTAPFFVIVYDLITASYVPAYDILIANYDKGIGTDQGNINLGDSLISYISGQTDKACRIEEVNTRTEGEESLKNKRADLLMVLPGDFSASMRTMQQGDSIQPFDLEFLGNITDVSYIVAAVLSYSFVSDFVMARTGITPPFNFKETAIGNSGKLTDFDLAVPGLLIFSIIMLMLTASVAMIAEVENKTLFRLKLSKVSTLELMGGITVVQVIVGLISVTLTLTVAAMLGFRFFQSPGSMHSALGSVATVFLVVVLTTISIIAFSLFIAAFSKSITQVLIIGNFPLFIFMFFTGAMFPIQPSPWFTAGGYPLSVISLMSPTHAVSALNKVLIMQQGFHEIVPELVSLTLLCLVYFSLGILAFGKRHMTG